jgi:hypothetical protein
MASSWVRLPQVSRVAASAGVVLRLAESGVAGTLFGIGSSDLAYQEISNGNKPALRRRLVGPVPVDPTPKSQGTGVRALGQLAIKEVEQERRCNQGVVQDLEVAGGHELAQVPDHVADEDQH